MENRQKINLRPVWDAILEVYDVFVAICGKYGLRYCGDCGTTLGAIRHGGFIPWDDDLDIEMPRNDYLEFVRVVSSELPAGYAWLDKHNCELYEQAFGKIIVTDRLKVESVAKASGVKLGQGIFIDVFPIDGYPDGRFGRFRRNCENCMLEMFAATNKIIRELGLVRDKERNRIWTHRILSDFYDKRARRYQLGATAMCVSVGLSRKFDDKPYPYSYFGKPRKVKFDNREMYVQEDADGYLKQMFGDYMKLPPVEARHPGHGLGEEMPWRFGPVCN